MVNLTMRQYRSKREVSKGYVQAKIQPSAELSGNSGVFMDINNHYEVLSIEGCGWVFKGHGCPGRTMKSVHGARGVYYQSHHEPDRGIEVMADAVVTDSPGLVAPEITDDYVPEMSPVDPGKHVAPMQGQWIVGWDLVRISAVCRQPIQANTSRKFDLFPFPKGLAKEVRANTGRSRVRRDSRPGRPRKWRISGKTYRFDRRGDI
ncbi:MAG: hypothetical protein U5L00_17700 [Desulfovermiculus sp.]|nr:hypothetical protein [Desulfovermiculus sp.]